LINFNIVEAGILKLKLQGDVLEKKLEEIEATAKDGLWPSSFLYLQLEEFHGALDPVGGHHSIVKR